MSTVVNKSALVVALLTMSALAHANGGPVAQTGSSLQGGVGPARSHHVTLVSEDLTIRIRPDMNRYDVRARYILSNPEAPRSVPFGIPVNDIGRRRAADAARESSDTQTWEPRSLQLRLEGEHVSCEIRHGRSVGPALPAELSPALEHALPLVWWLRTPVWCVAKLALPKAETIQLDLHYTGSLQFEDQNLAPSPITNFDDRELVYLLFPAGYWAGNAERVTIRLELGPFADTTLMRADGDLPPSPSERTAVLWPPGAKFGDGVIRWDFNDVDLTELGVLNVTFAAAGMLRHDELSRWNSRPSADSEGPVLTADGAVTASSTLAPQGPNDYLPANILDGDPSTAWCESTAGSAVGEWLELRFEGMHAHHAAVMDGLAIVPGYAKDQRTYRRNGRVSAIEVAHCNGGPSVEYRLQPTSGGWSFTPHLSERYNLSATLLGASQVETFADRLDLPSPERAASDGLCLRLRISEVEPGVTGDVCVSEVAAVINPNSGSTPSPER